MPVLEVSITLLPTPAGLSGYPEVLGCSVGLNTPSWSPPLENVSSTNRLDLKASPGRCKFVRNRRKTKSRGVAHTIREECERLFCEALRVVFLGEEGRQTNDGSYAVDVSVQLPTKNARCSYSGYTVEETNQKRDYCRIDAHIEIWDYMGGCNFRGFVGGFDDNKGLFIFFDSSAAQKDLKQGLMALIDFAESVFDVPRMVICLDRSIPECDNQALLKCLTWVGFVPITLELWAGVPATSDKWVFLGMQI